MIFRFVSYSAMCQGHEYLEIFISEGQYKKENFSKEILERVAMDSLSNFTLEKVAVVGKTVKTKISFANLTWKANLCFWNFKSPYWDERNLYTRWNLNYDGSFKREILCWWRWSTCTLKLKENLYEWKKEWKAFFIIPWLLIQAILHLDPSSLSSTYPASYTDARTIYSSQSRQHGRPCLLLYQLVTKTILNCRIGYDSIWCLLWYIFSLCICQMCI